MPTVDVEIVANRLPVAARRCGPLTDLTNDELLDEIAVYAKAFAPVRTGYLRDHIERRGNTVVSGADYSAYVEYGTSRMAAQPFMQPAVSTVAPTIPRYYSGFGIRLVAG